MMVAIVEVGLLRRGDEDGGVAEVVEERVEAGARRGRRGERGRGRSEKGGLLGDVALLRVGGADAERGVGLRVLYIVFNWEPHALI